MIWEKSTWTRSEVLKKTYLDYFARDDGKHFQLYPDVNRCGIVPPCTGPTPFIVKVGAKVSRVVPVDIAKKLRLGFSDARGMGGGCL